LNERGVVKRTMKLKKLAAVGHNAAASYMSTLSHIDGEYASTFIYGLAFKRGVMTLQLDVLNTSIDPAIDNKHLRTSLLALRSQFLSLLEKESLPAESVNAYTLTMRALGNQRDVVDLQCEPLIVDLNGKVHKCAHVRERYPSPIKGIWP
jgi:hypothetical protein